MGTETELKLQLDPARLQRLRRHPMVQRLKRGRPVTRLEKSVYFDTCDFRLLDHKAVLRVRHIGRRRIQTLKTMDHGRAWTRGEWEWEITGDEPELQYLVSPEIPFHIDLGGNRCQMLPVFSTEVRRTTYRLGDETWEVELSLDAGRLIAGERSAEICEAELELKRGELRHLFDLALQLQQDLSARLASASKSERGFALARDSQLKPQKAAPLALVDGISAAQAFRVIAHSCIGQLLANHDCLHQTKDPEAVHQMRVALRRLRSAMNIFKHLLGSPATLWVKDELRWLQGHLGPARDADVFIEEIIEPLPVLLTDQPGYVGLRGEFAARRDAAYQAALDAIALPRCSQLILRLAQWVEDGDWLATEDEGRRLLLDATALSVAQTILGKHHHKVRKGMRQLEGLDDSARHQIRIGIKKLRYAIEFFSSLYPDRKAKRLASAFAVLQDRLGLLNDIAVSRSRLRGVAVGDPDRLWVAGMIAGWHAARVPGLLAEARKDWKACKKLPPFWRD